MDINFEEAMERIKAETGCKTQVQLAATLGIRQSSISDAKRRGSIPSDWLVKLIQSHSLNPTWVLNGTGSQYLVPADESAGAGTTRVEYIEMPTAVMIERVLKDFAALDVEFIVRRGGEQESLQVVQHAS